MKVFYNTSNYAAFENTLNVKNGFKIPADNLPRVGKTQELQGGYWLMNNSKIAWYSCMNV